MVKASVIITSYNNSHNLERCLNSLINQNYDRNLIDLEIIVVDSGSTDNSIEIFEKYKNKIKVILKPKNSPRFSPAVARNIGVQNSNGEILIFTDSDCIPPSNWIKEMLVSFQNPEIDCVIGSREPDIGKGVGTFVRRYDFILYSEKFKISQPLIINKNNLQRNTPFVLMAGNNFGIKKELWNRIKGMKTIFKHPTGEDVMMEIEIIKKGYNILFNPNLKVNHIHPISLLKVFEKAFWNGESTYLLQKYSNNFVNWKHFAKRGHIFHLHWCIFYTLILILFLFIFIFLKLHFLLILTMFFLSLLFGLLINSFFLKRKLELVLMNKGKKYEELYKSSFFWVFCFNSLHFLTKLLSLISFLWCNIKYASFRRNIKRKR